MSKESALPLLFNKVILHFIDVFFSLFFRNHRERQGFVIVLRSSESGGKSEDISKCGETGINRAGGAARVRAIQQHRVPPRVTSGSHMGTHWQNIVFFFCYLKKGGDI